MPISDEVIELAPVKKTKSAFIGMIIGMVVLLGAAVAFLVLYLLKPSVTEDNNHIKSVTTNATGLFSMLDESGQEVLYASIGNEYIVYSTVTVDNDTAATVRWDVDADLVLVNEKTDNVTKDADGKDIPAYVKFIPHAGTNGKTAKIIARSAINPNEFMTVEFKIVNQGAEDIQVTQYGSSGSWHTITGDGIGKDLELTIPYYSNAASNNSESNKSLRVDFTQLGKHNPTSGEYSKITEIDVGGKKSNIVEVTSSNEDVVSVNQDSITTGEFMFTPKQSGEAIITIKANVNNSDFAEITKTIKIKVESNIDLGYVDSLYFFNKPVITPVFLDKIKKDTTTVNSAAIKAEVEDKDAGLSVAVYNDATVKTAADKDFTLVLPYSTGATVTYDNIFDHILVNPLNLQYSGVAINTAWHKNISITSSDRNILEVVNEDDGEVKKLYPKGVGSCTITIKDSKDGSVGSSLTVPVRIVAQTTKMAVSIGGKAGSSETLADTPATTGGKYTVEVTYTFVAPAVNNASSLLEDGCLNNKYSLMFDESELSVTLSGKNDLLKSGTVYSGEYSKIEKGTGISSNTPYTAVLTFDVTVKKSGDGSAVLKIIKNGSDLASGDLASKDGAFELNASFTITQKATNAWFKYEDADVEELLEVVTAQHTYAGNYVPETANKPTKAQIYVQNQQNGDLEMVAPDNLPQFVKADAAHFQLDNIIVSPNSSYLNRSSNNILSFTGREVTTAVSAATITFDVFDVDDNKLKSLALEIYLINAVKEITVNGVKDNVYYNESANKYVTINGSDVSLSYQMGAGINYTAYTDVELYYENGNVAFYKEKSATRNNVYTFAYQQGDNVLYEFDTSSKRLTIVADVYKYSYDEDKNFGDVELQFLIGSDYEYVGKHKKDDNSFKGYKGRLPIKFVRYADGVALYDDSHYNNKLDEKLDTAAAFSIQVNHSSDEALYVSSIIVKDGGNVYVEKDQKGHIAPVDMAYFMLPTEITEISNPSRAEGVSGNYYYGASFHVPEIEGKDDTWVGTVKWYDGGKSVTLNIIVNNQVRGIESIGIFTDADCEEASSIGESITFGYFGKVGESKDKYTQDLYIKIAYQAYDTQYERIESATLALPSYLEVVRDSSGDDNHISSLTLIPTNTVAEVGEYEIFAVKIRLIAGADSYTSDNNTISVTPNEFTDGNKAVSCNVLLSSGLKTLKVNDGGEDVTISANGSGSYTGNIRLENAEDAKSLTLNFSYIADNDATGSYNIGYVYANTDLLSVSVVGDNTAFNLSDLIQTTTDYSKYTLTVVPGSIEAKSYEYTFTFTDKLGEANNVFTFTLTINVTVDIYELAFEDAAKFDVTVTGGSGNAEPLNLNVLFNNDNSKLQPTADTIKDNTVLGVYTYDDGAYQEYTGDITVVKGVDGKSYTVTVANKIDRSVTYYLLLKYNGVTYKTQALTIHTEASHLIFDDDNNVELSGNGSVKNATIIVKPGDAAYKLAAAVVNVETGNPMDGTVTYGLYSDGGYITPVSGISVDGGIIAFTNPEAATGTLYYRAQYTDAKSGQAYELKVVITYKIVPATVEIDAENFDDNLFDADTNTLTLYLGDSANYTQADFTGKLIAKTTFGTTYSSADRVAYTIGISDEDRAYLNIDASACTIAPKAVKANGTVTVTVSAAFADVTVQTSFQVMVVSLANLTFASENGKLNLLEKDSSHSVVPNVVTGKGLSHTFTLAGTGDTSALAISGDGDTKTVKFADPVTAKIGDYVFNASVTYNYAGGDGITAITFTKTAVYIVKVEGSHTPAFNLKEKIGDSAATVIDLYESADKKHAIVDNATYSIEITESGNFTATYSATATGVISISDSAFSGTTATVTLIENASGEFSITVTATIGGEKFTCTQKYYFINGMDVTATLSMSTDGGTVYNPITTDNDTITQNIDFTDTAYKFKYELSGLPSDAIVNIAVSGVSEDKVQKDTSISNGKLAVVITATERTTLFIGGSVKIGTRTIYLEGKTLTLTATAPQFEWTNNKAEMLPAEEETFIVENKATGSGFKGAVSVEYSINSTTFASIGSTDGKLKAAANVLTDQTVIITATVTVVGGVYAGEYTLTKSVLIKGVPLPTISWNDGANSDVFVGTKDYDGLYEIAKAVTGHTYSSFDTVMSVTGLDSNQYEISGTQLTLKNITEGKIIRVTVTATINDDIHKGEKISATMLVRVSPTMNATDSTVKLGNAQNSYDLNGERFKSMFAPNGIAANAYRIVALSVTDTVNFGVDGSRLIVKNNLAASVEPVEVTATVLITSGEFAGIEVTGKKSIGFNFPSTVSGSNFTFADGSYGALTLNKNNVLGASVNGNVQGIDVIIPTDMLAYITVGNDGAASPTITLSKNYGAYLTSGDSSKSFTLSYIVTVNDSGVEYVYHNTVSYTADTFKVTVSAKVGEEPVTSDSPATVDSGNTVLVNLTADNGFTVKIDNVNVTVGTGHMSYTFGNNGVQIIAEEVEVDQDVTIVLSITVGDVSGEFTLHVKIIAPQSNSQYDVTNTNNVFAKDEGGNVQSDWNITDFGYKYAYSIVLTAPTGHNLSEYIKSVTIAGGTGNSISLTGNSATLYFNSNRQHATTMSSFSLNIVFNTDAVLASSTIRVQYVGYNRNQGGTSSSITTQYTIRVVGEVAVTLDYNAGGDTVTIEGEDSSDYSYTNPMYKGQYNLPELERTGYIFDGWFTSASGDNQNNVERNATVTRYTAHTLYAHWTARTYTLKYNANYEQAPEISDTKQVTYGQPYGELTTPTREGYEFIGWTVESETVTATSLVKPTQDTVEEITLYAQWRIKYYTVTIDAGDGYLYGETSSLTVEVAYGSTFTLHAAITPTREGHKFTGWDKDSSIVVNESSWDMETQTITITAQWELIATFTVTLNASGGKIGEQEIYTVTLNEGETYLGYTLIVPTRDNYRFDGWYTKAQNDEEGGTKQTEAIDSETTLYAHWTQVVFTVTLDAGEGKTLDGTNRTLTFEVKSVEELNKLLAMIHPIGTDEEEFDGWYYNEEPWDEETLNGDITLTANWSPVEDAEEPEDEQSEQDNA